MSKINVLRKEPGKEMRPVQIENTLEGLQEAVGGYIEAVTLATDAAVICNEEGRLLGMPHCCVIGGVDFVGPILIVGVKGEEFEDLPGDEGAWKRAFAGAWEGEA